METEWRKADTAFSTGGIPNTTSISKVPLTEIGKRIAEMGECWSVDHQKKIYVDAFQFYDYVQLARCLRFVMRHNLMPQLMQEDAEGKR